ncbi:DUF5810 domain-containing protein [Halosolutus amylolyticus]|uniref:DUF5810 domain-containing protein n=1 Tax=Halosolutus amylolyticus TaxID=2932267 RepID=A0ABD5PPX4_9EURY|nr:DUF5810 domain-containing protein [Halosolutus amylolyticus]
MGYACPVCDAEQADAEHLANHLAVTAALGRADHRDWLEEHAPDWADRGPEDLGTIVSEYAPEIETPEFESGHGHEPTFEDELARQSRGPGRGALTSEAEGVLEEARELTRQMQAGDAESDDRDGTDGEPEPESGENENA